jgi:hypothetical protein
MSVKGWLVVIGSCALIAGFFWWLLVSGGVFITSRDRSSLFEAGLRLKELVYSWLVEVSRLFAG